ncbi:MAG TPA: J domain-containing protein [Kofleriaceae bacterium]|nr:J domain-containing protein [Kofleriaceae bacterium]
MGAQATFECRSRGELVRVLYRLGHQQASGILTITGAAVRELFSLRRGGIVVHDELAKRTQLARLARLAALAPLHLAFEGGISSYPPGAQHVVPLATWARVHLESQLDNSVAERMVRELAGMRLSIKAELAPQPNDEADRRMIAAMTQPRRLDQIWPLARTPRFRLLAFLHFLRAVEALEVEGIVAERSAPNRLRGAIDPKREAAARLLGLEEHADVESIKRAYRRIARSLHPDLQPHVDDARKKTLEARFAEVTAAYELLA